MVEKNGYEMRKELLNAINIIKKFNELPFYPQQESNFTSTINGFSSIQCNNINEIVDKFNSKIKEWDFRE
ncbi:hypothetical protein ES702_02962 [subsurface metagenome]